MMRRPVGGLPIPRFKGVKKSGENRGIYNFFQLAGSAGAYNFSVNRL